MNLSLENQNIYEGIEKMFIILVEMYLTLLPAILAGVFNMVWCKVPVANALNIPIDRGHKLSDGKRIFGNNKTWKGFVGMIVFGCVFTVLWGFASHEGYLLEHNYFYANRLNTVGYNVLIGSLVGFAYALFELPNSFLKRRLDISPGKTTKGIKKIFFIFLDQADSIFGCVIVVALVYEMTLGFYLLYVLIGAATHIVINILLYFAKLRKNMF